VRFLAGFFDFTQKKGQIGDITLFRSDTLPGSEIQTELPG
jgi:hypothetical protein